MKFISSFVPPILSYETEHPSSPSLELEPCPSSHQDVVLDNGRDSTLLLHDISFEKENFRAMDISKLTLETKRKDSTNEHENFSFENPHVSCSLLESPEFILLSTTCTHENHNLLPILVHKLFRRMVVDVFVYQKYYKSHGCIVVLTLQLKRKCPMFGGEAWELYHH